MSDTESRSNSDHDSVYLDVQELERRLQYSAWRTDEPDPLPPPTWPEDPDDSCVPGGW